MATTTQPTIAHGIARLHPEQRISPGQYQWGPDWALPPARSGRWAIDKIYNAAIRVEFDESVPLDPTVFSAGEKLSAAREALSAEDERRRAEWLGYADKREAAEFVRAFHVRRRREHGDLPSVAKGTFLRGVNGSGVWHIATGSTSDAHKDERVWVWTECSGSSFSVDLGDPDRRTYFEAVATVPAGGSVCRRCTARVSAAPSPVAELARVTA